MTITLQLIQALAINVALGLLVTLVAVWIIHRISLLVTHLWVAHILEPIKWVWSTWIFRFIRWTFNGFIRFITALVYRDDTLNVPNLIGVTSYILFIVVTGYLVINNINWGAYTTFSGVTVGGLATHVISEGLNIVKKPDGGTK